MLVRGRTAIGAFPDLAVVTADDCLDRPARLTARLVFDGGSNLAARRWDERKATNAIINRQAKRMTPLATAFVRADSHSAQPHGFHVPNRVPD